MNEVFSVTIFGINVTINPVAFTLPIFGGWEIRWYGILIAVGFLLALFYASRNAKRFNVDYDRLFNLVLVGLPISIFSARLYFVVFYEEKLTSVAEIFGLGGHGFSGLAIYGGVIGAVLSTVVIGRLMKLKLLDVLDLASIGFLIGQGIGRWGNFFNQEAFGAATGSSFWGMTSESVAKELGAGVLAHPCFLYESFWCLVGVFLLHNISKSREFSGQITAWYCLWYGLGRTVIEGLRTDSLWLGPVRISQVLSAVLAIVGAAVLLRAYIKKKKTAAEAGYVPVFGDAGGGSAPEEEKSAEPAGDTEKSEEKAAEPAGNAEEYEENGADNQR